MAANPVEVGDIEVYMVAIFAALSQASESVFFFLSISV
jgi:hypothetical protein